MKLSSAKRKYRGEWLAFRFSDPVKEEGHVFIHEKDRSRLFERLRAKGKIPSRLYVSFAGPVLPKDVGIVLLITP